MNTQTPTPTETPDHDMPPKRGAAMAGAFWMLARVLIVLPLLTPFWLLYALCVGAGNLAEFLWKLCEALQNKFHLAFGETDAYAEIEEAFDDRRELRARVKELEFEVAKLEAKR